MATWDDIDKQVAGVFCPAGGLLDFFQRLGNFQGLLLLESKDTLSIVELPSQGKIMRAPSGEKQCS